VGRGCRRNATRLRGGTQLKVLLVPYPATWQHEGGHRTQQSETASALRRLGVDAEIGNVEIALDSSADVVHFFGDPRPLLARGRPRGRLIVSPVHWPSWVELGPVYRRGGTMHVLSRRVQHSLAPLRRPRAVRRRRENFEARLAAIAAVDLVVTNSNAEAALLAADTNGPLPPVHVAHSGVDASFAHGDARRGGELVGCKSFVLCVGRVEPIKNQLSLALAMRKVPETLVLVGEVLPGNESYLADCRHALPSLIHVPHIERAALPHVYAAAKAHVLPSWFETTGLATMEALAAGLPAVAGRSVCVEEYFKDRATLVSPLDIRSLRRAIHEELDRGVGRGRDVVERYSWDRTARELLDAYNA
jgi:glycosyltransferase involved in cell wall biosynthesis